MGSMLTHYLTIYEKARTALISTMGKYFATALKLSLDCMITVYALTHERKH